MKIPMMKCGHSGNAEHKGKPACVICFPKPESLIIDEDYIPEVGRKARCSYYGKRNYKGDCRSRWGDITNKTNICKCEKDSSTELPFFTLHPDKEFDEFYCGCFGWE